ncbi:rhodanese-like domain-containing protein [Enterococcus sp. BWB1-3]|uniref:rhodanese-like domain-containing protein n=1 Tax=unclassified Enterococcus TaxID=2608891 RepID=UPI0019247961|nr:MULTISPECIES: rhodanese-like domain-containing protein [unclassified Enterococcus]MBL1230633.1 rhodanese-like domain-containing protein [Enterococcus sp. BWB1-3]MCB5952220.1 rhodanese-like domain-containing protein [Enterococcus sp. BWT-B8]MCB5956061.1 rhodanese-like domain-containing protein [Enterococcus sp. CWB-B31]
MSGLLMLNIILGLVLLAMVGNTLYMYILGKRSAKLITEDEFREGMRKGQVIDVREKDAFDAGHILGARSLPYSMLKTSMQSLRKDQPIYLYDQKRSISIRTASKLKKAGYTDIYVLKDGYEGWTGKIKKKSTL